MHDDPFYVARKIVVMPSSSSSSFFLSPNPAGRGMDEIGDAKVSVPSGLCYHPGIVACIGPIPKCWCCFMRDNPCFHTQDVHSSVS